MNLFRSFAHLFLLSLVLTAFLFSFPLAAPASADQGGKVMLVLDASGSMWGRVEDREKILIAREVIGQMIDQWDPALQLGLVAYGHRTKGECSDIETLVPVGGSLEQIRDTVNKLQPRGKTPLSAAVQQAAEDLRFTEDKATVILVSDGKETCDLDPCDVGRNLEKLGVDFTAHVIGFDIAEADRAGLACLATETGGQYFDARKTDELKSALAEAVQKIKQQPDTVIARLGSDGAELASSQISWSAEIATGEKVEATGPSLSLPLQPGSWQVTAQLGNLIATGKAEVTIDQAKQHVVMFDAAELELAAVVRVSGKPVDASKVSWSIIRASDETEVATATGQSATRIVAAGSYQVLATYATQTSGAETTVDAGARERVEIVFDVELARLAAPDSVPISGPFDVAWQGPDGKGDYVTVIEPDADDNKYGKYFYTETGSPGTLVAPDKPGSYEIRYRDGNTGQILARRAITVDDVAVELAAQSSSPVSQEITIAWKGPDGKGDYITVVTPDTKDGKYAKYQYTREGSPLSLLMPDQPGTYELRYMSGQSSSVLARRPIEIEPVAVTLSAPQSAAMSTSLEVSWTGPNGPRDYISVADSDSPDTRYWSYRYTREGSPLALTLPDKPGVYELRYVSNQSDKVLARTPITVEETAVNLAAPESTAISGTIEVAWQGPDGARDYLSIAALDAAPNKYVNYTYTREGSPLKLRMPDVPGQYEIRYVSNQSDKVLASRPISVDDVAVTMAVVGDVSVSQPAKIEWVGPDGNRDYLTVVSPDEDDNKHGKYQYTREGSPIELLMPDQPGQYELRYVSGQSKKVLGRQAVEVTGVDASLKAPDSATIGASLDVDWQGPGGARDVLTIVVPEADDDQQGKYWFTNSGNPLRVVAPDVAGIYEIRYLSGQSKVVQARKLLEVRDVAVTLESLSILMAGKPAKIHWTGPQTKLDRIAVSELSQTDQQSVHNVFANETPVSLTMPKEPGPYELRYVTAQTKQVLARKLVQVVAEADYSAALANAAPGKLKVSASSGGTALADDIKWQIYGVDGVNKTILDSTEANPVFELPMGLYRINLSGPSGSSSKDVMMDSGSTIVKELQLP